MASDIIQNGAFAEQKTVVATISIHTHTHHTLPKTPQISATIHPNSFSNIFSDIVFVYNVENKIDFAKNRAAPPWIRPCIVC